MKTNVGGIDKILRVVVGIALIAMAALGVVGAWGWIGVVLDTKPDWAEVAVLVRDSYRLVATAKLRKALDASLHQP